MPPDWSTLIHNALDDRRANQTLRQPRPLRFLDSTHVELAGRRLINFASNNYLGLTHHPRVIAAFQAAADKFGVGSGSAALVTGHSDLHESAEQQIAAWKKTESARLLSSGYTANLAAVQTLNAIATNARFLIDRLCHASLIDAVRATGANFRVYPHNHLGKLQRLLEEADPQVPQVVVTESIFSMDGDTADLPGIVELKKRFPFLLLLDEAHGSGVYGLNGAGYAAELGLGDQVDLTIVTLSKAIGCTGGAICGSKPLCDAIANFGRPFVYSTSIPPAVPAAVMAAIDVMRDEPQRQKRVREWAARVRSAINQPGDSPIIPIPCGDESAALSAAEKLLELGFLVIAIRPPTVPRGTSRLRVTVSCDHTGEEIERLIIALK